MTVHTLECGPCRLVVDAGVGGSVRAFTFHGEDILRPAADASPEPGQPAALGTSGFPMLPYTGRIAQARFDWEGGTVALPRNFPPEPHAIHGTGWQAGWDVVDSGPSHLLLAHVPDARDWPWRMRAEQRIELRAVGLTLSLSVRNEDDTAMPAGLGWHPYFVRGDAELSVATTAMWANDEGGVSARRVDPPPGLDGSQARHVRDLSLDNAFDVERVDATLVWPAKGLRAQLSADEAFGNLVIYAPDEDYVCIEPATHAPDALNTRPAGRAAMARLDPGEALSGHIRLNVARI